MTTKAALFSHIDEVGAAPLRPGLWRFDVDPDCNFDDGASYQTWPECAGGAVLAKGHAAYYDHKSGEPVLRRQDFVLAAGEPRIFQVRLSVGGDVGMDNPPYVYAGAHATKSDRDGRIEALLFWPVQCGPPPPSGEGATRRPLAGMIVKPGDPVCTTVSKQALRAAAKASQAWAPRPLAAHWLRDGPR